MHDARKAFARSPHHTLQGCMGAMPKIGMQTNSRFNNAAAFHRGEALFFLPAAG